MTKVFVGNFSFNVDQDGLKEFFSKVGNVVSAKVMTEGIGGRSRGFGFVEFSSPEEARRAIEELNGAVWDSRVIKVSEDRGARRDQGPAEHRSTGHGDAGDQHRWPQAPMGYFRAQPLDLGVRKRRKSDPFIEDETLKIDYKNAKLLRRFMSERGRVLPRRMTGLTATNQRLLNLAIKRAQQLAMLPIVND